MKPLLHPRSNPVYCFYRFCSPAVNLCRWLGSKHPLTNQLSLLVCTFSCFVSVQRLEWSSIITSKLTNSLLRFESQLPLPSSSSTAIYGHTSQSLCPPQLLSRVSLIPFSFRQPPTFNWHKISWIHCLFFCFVVVVRCLKKGISSKICAFCPVPSN